MILPTIPFLIYTQVQKVNDGLGAYTGTPMKGIGALAWTSFAQIAGMLILVGFCIRCIALLRLAVAGRGNVLEVSLKLFASIIGILLIRAFL